MQLSIKYEYELKCKVEAPPSGKILRPICGDIASDVASPRLKVTQQNAGVDT